MLPCLVLTMGDPAGIGPEIIVKALAQKKVHEVSTPVVVGDRICIEDAMQLTHSNLTLRIIDQPENAIHDPNVIQLINLNILNQGEYRLGQVSAMTGEAAFQYIIQAISLAMSNRASAVVTGPINKEAIHLAGHHFSGHTEIFAEYTNTPGYAMMLTCKNLRVVHCTTHISMRKATELISEKRVLETIVLAYRALRDIGIPNGRIGVAGFNCHASENGLFGDEEGQAIIPAIQQAQSMGINAEGPIPPDTVFVKAIAGQFDIVVAMYHDQGHIPLKLYGFKVDPVTKQFTAVNGINVTIGLPIIRTSVDHGTAFDIAGKGIANEDSMIEAIEMAARMSKSRMD